MNRPTRRRQLLRTLSLSPAAIAPALRAAGGDSPPVGLYADPSLAAYGFPPPHPFGTDRQGAFLRVAGRRGLLENVGRPGAREATTEELLRFHSEDYVELVRTAEARGRSLLDAGDTPVFAGVYPAAARVVGTALEGMEAVMAGRFRRTLQPIGGLHHAGRGHAAGFCVFSDLGVVIESLRARHGIRRIGYVDIDVHHGDGIFYAFEDDPDLIFADIHQDGRTLYPGTGRPEETGTGAAEGTKLNVALAPDDGDEAFLSAWPAVQAHLGRFEPEFVLFQCGADGGAGDPLARLKYTERAHAHAARGLRDIADRHAQGRIMAFGGGGYDRANLAAAWSAVLGEWLRD